MTVCVGYPNQGNRAKFVERVREILDSNWFTNDGTFVQEFELKIQRYLGVKHCIAVNNATTGLMIAAKALDLTGQVILPAFTFIATAHAMEWIGLQPVFCDTAPGSYTLAPREVDRLINDQTSAVLAVNTFGNLCDIKSITALCNEHDIKLIFDSAHAFGCSDLSGTRVGNFGDCEVFSFHATKIIHTFEGGVITTSDSDLAEKCRLMRNFGFADEDLVLTEGINGKMSEVCAAMGITMLESFESLVNVNKSRYFAYAKYFEDFPTVRVICHSNETRNNYQYIAIEVPVSKRDHIVKLLRTRDVIARRYFYPGCHQCPPYTYRSNIRADVPNTDKLCGSVIVLPTGPSVSLHKVEEICQLIKYALTNV